MATDLDQRLTAVLGAYAEGDTDAARLVAGARQRGRRLRRGRQALTAVAAAAVAAASLMLPVGPQSGPSLPVAPDRLGAAQQPGLVGADPATVHFTADGLVDDSRHVTWSTGRGTESVEYHGRARFVLARSVAELDAVRQVLASAGKPAPEAEVRVEGRAGLAWPDEVPGGDLRLWFVQWQPAEGLWGRLEIYADSLEEATDAAGRLRFDGARRCAVPFRLESLPAGARLLACSVTLDPASDETVSEGSLVVGDAGGRWLTVRAQRPERGLGDPVGELRAGPYQVRRQGAGGVLTMTVRPCRVELFLNGEGNGYTEQDGLTVLSGYRPVG